MKKSRIILAIVLAVVLVIVCMNVPTFSWFSRPHSQDGEKALFGGSNGTYQINAFNGKSVTASTMGSDTGVDGTYTTNCNGNYACGGTNVPNNNRKYFCTTLTNNSGTEQNVSLFARTLSIPTSNNGTLAIGVNGPTRGYHDYSALATPSKKTTRDMMRIYFEKDNSVSGWNGTDFYICWNEDPNTGVESLDSTGSNGTYTKLIHVGGNNNPNQYYADIPKTATHAFFCVENWGTNNNGQENWGQRSQTLFNLAGDGQTQTASKLYKITSSYKNNDSGSNHLVRTPPYSVTGNCINSYYSNIFVATGNTFDARLASSEYIGGDLEYYSDNESVFKVYNDNNGHTKGYIYPQGAGTATLYTKSVGGSYPDTQQVETTVNVTSSANYVFNDVPIVKNIQIPASTANDANVVKVYWYVINNSPTTALSYSIDNVYVGV